MSVVIETTLGDITVDLYLQERLATCRNFLALCALKYYNHCSFHFVQPDFIAQTGDPTGTGSGGESAYARVHGSAGRFIEAEKKPKLKHDRAGLISMVNNGENLHGSQFFFTLSHSLDYLDGVHTVFGEVVEGLEVLAKLNDTICDEKHVPYQDILITHTVVLEDPFPKIEGLEYPTASPEYNFDDLLKTDRIGIGEEMEDADKPVEIIEEELKDKDAKQRALVLEMIGDLPDADVAPPENVLFICKLNPVTREEDLEVIFSRFGPIVSCEIIKDDRSGESLQYGFIEFEKQEDCEQAFFKMDNVLIDDRRIHVDFSQSVSKLKWKGKGRGVAYLNDDDENENDRSAMNNYVRSMGSGGQRNGQEHRGRGQFKVPADRRDYQQQYNRDSYRFSNNRSDRRRDSRSTSPPPRERRHDRGRNDGSSSSSNRKRERSRSRDRDGRRDRDKSSSSSSKHHRRESDRKSDRDRSRDDHRHKHSSSSKHSRR